MTKHNANSKCVNERPDWKEKRKSILACAIDLFAKQGFNRTTMKQIAGQVGIENSSIYYYFGSKSEVAEAIFNPLEHTPSLEQLERLSESRAEQLFALIVRDTVHKCELPFDFIEMEALAHQEPNHFPLFFKQYRIFYQNLVYLIERGTKEGEFTPGHADERAATILSINEGLQHHFHAKLRGELILEESGYTVRNHTPEKIGQMAARSIIPSFLTDPTSFSRADERGTKLYYRIEEERLHGWQADE